MADVGEDLAVLIVEDSETDAELVLRELRRGGFSPKWQRVDTARGLREALTDGRWDLVISDSSVPGLNASEAIGLAKEVFPDVPFIVVSGSMTEEEAVDAMRLGAADYVTKENLGRLGPAVARELQETRGRETRRQGGGTGEPSGRAGGVDQKLRRQREQLLALSRRLLEAQEAERRKIARELHDEFGQLLTAVKLNLETVQRRQRATRKGPLAEALSLVNRALDQVRRLSLELWPTILDELGLPSALRWLGDRQARWSGFTVRVDIDPVGRLPPSVETACFRLVQEALTNAARHAQAQNVQIRLRAGPHSVEVLVHDDGTGFDVAAARERAAAGASLGLLGMQERVSLAGGQLEIESGEGRGTTVRAHLPIPPGRLP